jgi:hypothetical protein
MSMAAGPHRHRVIMHLHDGAGERAIIRAAAELAQLLGLALHGVFLEEALPELASLPFIREFRLTTGEWHKLERAQLADEQRAAATEARRMLDEAAGALGVMQLFDVVSGDPALFIAASSQAGDIIVVAQPRLPAEALVHATAQWLQAAHACAASVMLVPRGLTRRQGPVAAVVCAESDPALRIAARIAAAAGESLLLLVWGQREFANGAAEQARAGGLASDRIVVRSIAGVMPEDVLQGLGGSTERLVVLARGACGADNAAVSSHIAASRGVPVLVVEP